MSEEAVVPEVFPEVVPEVIYQFVPEVFSDVVTEVVPEVVSFETLINERAMLLQREAATKTFLTENLITVSASQLKPDLLHWATTGFQPAFAILHLNIDVPQVCSDGVSRSVSDYINFCMGEHASQVYSALSSKLPGISVSYAIIGNILTAYVSKN